MRFHSSSRIVSTHGSPVRIGQDSRERLRRLLEPDAPPPRRTATQLLQALLQRSTPLAALLLFLGLGAVQPLRAIEFPPGLTNDTRLTNILVNTNIVVITNDIPNPPKLTNLVFWSTPGPVPATAGPDPLVVFLEVARPPADTNASSVRMTTTDDTARAGIDYVAVDRTLTFGPGISRVLTQVEIRPDPHTGRDPRSFTVNLSDPVNAVVVEPSTITVVISPGPEAADLSLTATTATPSAFVSDLVVFNASVQNAGPVLAPNVVARVLLPPGLAFVSAIPAGYDPATARWEIGAMAPGGSAQIAITARAERPMDVTFPVEIIDSGVPDPDSTPANGAAGEDDIAFVVFKAEEELADLKVTVEAKPAITNVSEKITFTVSVENLGPRNAKDIIIDDVIPAGLTLDSHKAAPGSAYNAATGAWTLPALNNGARATLELVVKAQRGGAFTNVATLRASKPRDPVAENNRGEAAIFFMGYSACGIARICNNVTNLPNPNATVTLDGPLKLNGRTDALGTFCFTNLLAGKYKVTITPADPAAGIEVWTADVDVGPDGDTIDAIANWLIIVGRVTLGTTNGPPVVGLTVEAVNGADKRSAKTDANGEYRIVPVDKKEYTVSIKDLPAGQTSKPANVAIDPTLHFDACPPRADFVINGKLGISGVVRGCNARGPLLASAQVTLTGKDLTVTQTVRTGPDGRYAFRDLPPGKYTVSISHPTHAFNPRAVDITLDKASATRNFIGDPERSLGGRVVMRNGQPIPGVEIVVLEARLIGPPVRRTTTTDVHGEWVLKGLPAALYEITPTPPDASFVFTPRFARFVLGGPGGDCGNYFTFQANRNAVELLALEAVQVIQDWQNNVPLVQDKATLIRAFVKPVGTNRTPVVVNNARLRVMRDGRQVGLYGSESGGMTARPDYAQRRNLPETSIPFRLPADALKGTNTITLEWPGGQLITSTAPGQTAVRNNRTEIKFKAMPEIPIRWVLVNWVFGAKGKGATEALANSHRSRVLAGMPTAKLPSVATSRRAFDWKPALDPTDPANDQNMQLSSTLLRALARLKRDDRFDVRSRAIYHGVVDGANLRGAGDIQGGNSSFADVSALGEARRNLPIHEVGHALGRHHAVHSVFGIQLIQGEQWKRGLCNEVAEVIAPDYPMDVLRSELFAPVLGPMRLGEFRYGYGWDSGGRRYVSPFSTADIMSYCTTDSREFRTDWTWPGIFSYTGMMGAVESRFGRPAAPRGLGNAAPAGDPVPVVRVSGMLDGDGRLIEFDPVTVRDETWEQASEGEFFLQLVDASGNVLTEQRFDASAIAPDALGSDSKYYREFYVTAPWTAGTASIEIHRAGILIGRLVISPNTPELSWLAPAGETALPMPDTGIPIAWQASDADGDTLRARIETSADDGTSWSTLAMDLTESTFTLRPDHLPKAGTHRVRVTVSDGFNARSVQMPAAILTSNQAPSVVLLQPTPDTAIDRNAGITLTAEAADAEDGELTAIRWSSDRAGALGEGAELILEPGVLAPGTHRITATVTDSAGSSTAESVDLVITEPTAPALRLAVFEDRIELRWPASAADRLVEAAFELADSEWFRLEVEPELDGEDAVLRLPLDETETMFYRISAVTAE
jgi:uncharacterized repeat protein (TIGR01451 family)